MLNFIFLNNIAYNSGRVGVAHFLLYAGYKISTHIKSGSGWPTSNVGRVELTRLKRLDLFSQLYLNPYCKQ